MAYGWRIVYGWLMVGTLLGDGWHMVDLWLVIVGAMLGDSWLLVGFWLAVIVGPTFIQRAKLRWPTKYVAVWPTLSQRLGFGWQMVSVLAGIRPNYIWGADFRVCWWDRRVGESPSQC